VELYFFFLALAALFIGACHLPLGPTDHHGRRPYSMFSAVAAIICAALAAIVVFIPMFD
jgi:uncharacterized membrane protein YfhO